MEKIENCNIVINIESIDKVSGGNQFYEVFFVSSEKIKYKIIFDFVWDFRCSIENAYIGRAAQFCHNEREKSSVLLVKDSVYVKYFEEQMSGTRPINEIKNYILFDSIDTIIEVLTLKEPVLMKI